MALPQSAAIVAHWSADSLALADNDPVSSWSDSVNSIAATQATGSKQPTFKTNIYNSKPCVRFDGTADVLGIATPGAMATAINTQTFTVMIVFQKIANTANTYGNLFHYQATVGGANAYYICDNDRIHRYPMKSTSGSIPYTTLNAFSSFGTTSGVGGVLALSALEREYINGGCVMSALAKGPGGTTSDFEIGADDTNGFFANADIFEVVVWNVELTPPEVAEFHDWACTKYAQATPWSTKDSLIVFDGDSLTEGVGVGEAGGADGTQAGSYPYVAAQSLGLSYGQWSNLGIGYLTMAQMNTKFATDVAPYETKTGKHLKIAAFEWYNQKAASPTPRNHSLDYLTTARSATIKVAFGTSTDSTDSEVDRGAYNDYFDANHTSATMDAYVSLHTATHVGPDGSYSAYPTYYSASLADNLHLSALGYAEVAGLFVTALNSISFGRPMYAYAQQ